MVDPGDVLHPVSPATVLRKIVAAIPSHCRRDLIIIGSLAVGWRYFGDRAGMAVHTKDADCLLSPNVKAVPTGIAITEELLDAGWQPRKGAEWSEPGDDRTPVYQLPAVRLQPPDETAWFLKLLTVPKSAQDRQRTWVRLATRHGHFGICSFGFLSLANLEPIATDFDLRVARPEMMALANLLEHPAIGPETMAGGFAGRPDVRRSNKDLGRVIAIARLATEENEDVLDAWSPAWESALRIRFPDDWRTLAAGTGRGLRELMDSPRDLEQAYFTCINGLLASRPPTLEAFRVAAERLLQDAIVPLERVE